LLRTEGSEVFLSFEIIVPDGQRLSSYQVSPNAEYILYSFTSNDFVSTSWLVEVNTGNRTQIPDHIGNEARWHPDITAIALITDNRTQLTLYDVATNEISQLFSAYDDSLTLYEIRWMRWSPNGQYLLYSDEYTNHYGEQTLRLYLHDFESNTRSIVEDNLQVHHLDFRWVSTTEFVYTIAETALEPNGSYQTDFVFRDAITLDILYRTRTEESELLDCGFG
ncbi:MAG: hypothetical protein AAFV93_11075, partial [Chloroflexota bacterium]